MLTDRHMEKKIVLHNEDVIDYKLTEACEDLDCARVLSSTPFATISEAAHSASILSIFE